MPSQRFCPTCEKTFSAAHVQAWLVYGTIPVVFDSLGHVEAVGPVTPTILIKPGKELQSRNLELVCPKCSTVGTLESFPMIRICELTGVRADMEMTVEGLGTIAIHSSIREMAEQMFSQQLFEDVAHLFGE